MNGKVEVTWRTLHKISHSLMVHARVLEAYIHFAFIYTAYHIFPVLPIKDMINKYGEPTTPLKLVICTKPSVSYFCVLFFPRGVLIGTKALNMRHQAQTGFCSIFVGILRHQKGYIFYVPNRRKVISPHDFFFNIFYSALVYTSQPYSEAMNMRPAV